MGINACTIAKVIGHLALIEAIIFSTTIYLGKGLEALPFPIKPMVLFSYTTSVFGIVLLGEAWYMYHHTAIKKCISVTLGIFGVISLFEGVGFVAAIHLGKTEKSLPLSPLALLTWMVAFYGVMLISASKHLQRDINLKEQGVATGAGDKKTN